MNRGTTLLELVFVLLLIGSIAGVGVRAARRAGDLAAVLTARESVVAALAEARSRAVIDGRAGVDVVPSAPMIGLRTVHAAGGRWVTLPSGVLVDVVPRRDTLSLRFDAIGVGRFTSASVSFQRGEARRSVTVSTYGRVTRR